MAASRGAMRRCAGHWRYQLYSQRRVEVGRTHMANVAIGLMSMTRSTRVPLRNLILGDQCEAFRL